MPQHTGLGDTWVETIVGLGGDAVAAKTSAAELERRYGEAHRSYHDAGHVKAVLADIDRLAGEVALDNAQLAAAVLAGCAHDVVYDLRPGADERASAGWARAALLAAGIDAAVGERVAELVLLTIAHDCDAADLAGAVLLDADLAILGSEPADYERYVRAVRAEYATVSDDDWRRGRTAVLEGLQAGSLFRTRPGHQRWDTAARHNLAAELSALQVG